MVETFLRSNTGHGVRGSGKGDHAGEVNDLAEVRAEIGMLADGFDLREQIFIGQSAMEGRIHDAGGLVDQKACGHGRIVLEMPNNIAAYSSLTACSSPLARSTRSTA